METLLDDLADAVGKGWGALGLKILGSQVTRTYLFCLSLFFYKINGHACMEDLEVD